MKAIRWDRVCSYDHELHKKQTRKENSKQFIMRRIKVMKTRE